MYIKLYFIYYLRSFMDEVLVWALSFHIYPLPDPADSPIKWLDIAGILSHTLFPYIKILQKNTQMK